jgi:hypothetical protein
LRSGCGVSSEWREETKEKKNEWNSRVKVAYWFSLSVYGKQAAASGRDTH